MRSGISRRTFLAAGASLVAAGCGWTRSSGRHIRLYVGSYTNASGEVIPAPFGSRGPDVVSSGISTFTFDTETGSAGPVSLAAECSNPVNLIINGERNVLYACRGQSTIVDGQNLITAFAIRRDGGLRELNTVRCGGGGPTVGVVDRSSRNLLTTNFLTDSIVNFRLHRDGSLAEMTSMIGFEPDGELPPSYAPGAEPERTGCAGKSAADFECRELTKPHAVVLSGDERFAIAAEIRTNQCRVMRYDADSGVLTTHQRAPDADGAGPRHLAWHPSYRFLYSSGEHNSSISAWRWDGEQGRLEWLQNLSSLPRGYEGRNFPADIAVHPSGRFVYVTNRGAGTLAGYRVDEESGLVEPIADTPIGSPSCWSLRFDPEGKWAFAAALVADRIVIYRVDANSGRLTATDEAPHVVLASCVRLA